MLKDELDRDPALLEHYRRISRKMAEVLGERRKARDVAKMPEPEPLVQLIEKLRIELNGFGGNEWGVLRSRIRELNTALHADWEYLWEVRTRLGDVKLRATQPLLRSLVELKVELEKFAVKFNAGSEDVAALNEKIRAYVNDNQFVEEPALAGP